MKKFIQTIKNIWKIEDLKSRIITTALLLLIYRLGTFVVMPGIDPNALAGLQSQGNQGIFGFVNMFSGGAFSRASIFALGIMPYISASIVIQLLSVAVPSFQKMQKEGEDGRRKINQITRMLTIAITAVQAVGYMINLNNESGAAIVDSGGMFMFTSVIVLVAGTMFTMWLGERITDKGLGNGISLIIMVGIVARLPYGLAAEFDSRLGDVGGGLVVFLVELVAWLAVILAVIALVQGTRKIPVQYAKRVVGNRLMNGARSYIPLKVNAAGVMPIIFAQALLFIPSTIATFLPDGGSTSSFLSSFMNPVSWGYNITTAVLIILFTYFYTAIAVSPNNMADELKRNGGFIPGIKPGRQTAEFIDNSLSKITLPGSIFLAFVAIIPSIAMIFEVNNEFAQFYGGTSLLIMVGVVLDTLQQIESHLLMRQYDGLLQGGAKIKGRSPVNVGM
jgi:preprotein translocase subunit SecY